MVNVKYAMSKMVITETDVEMMTDFVHTEHIENDISESYFVLHDFARDCHYGNFIEVDLMDYLLPFYLKTIGSNHQVAIEVCESFTLALRCNPISFIKALGKNTYREIISCYVERTIQLMNEKENHIAKWLPYFNTAIAFDDFNFHLLLKTIFESSTVVRYAFFQYLTILLFKEEDNLVVDDKDFNQHIRPWWTSYIWAFLCHSVYWNHAAIGYFDKVITKEKIYACFDDVSDVLIEKHGKETYEMIGNEMKISFKNGTFDSRKKQFLEKIGIGDVRRPYFYEQHL